MEYGDRSNHEKDEDSSDFSIHQFLVSDDGRDGPSSGNGDDKDVANEAKRRQALAREDHFNSEETPDPDDSFVQVKTKSARTTKKKYDGDDDQMEYGDRSNHEKDEDSSDFSIHQFLVSDDGRDGPASGNGDDNDVA